MKKNTYKLLVVEDETSLREAIVDKFSKENFEVIEARDGEEALAQATEKTPDVILLDIVLPKKDGMTFLKELRAMNAWGKSVPVILLTNLSADDEITRAVAENEPSYYLIKSDWTLDDVMKKVEDTLGHRD